MAKWLRLSICMDYVFELTALAPAHEWRESSSVLRPRQHSIGYMGDGFYRSKDPTNSIKVLKGHHTGNGTLVMGTKYLYLTISLNTSLFWSACDLC